MPKSSSDSCTPSAASLCSVASASSSANTDSVISNSSRSGATPARSSARRTSFGKSAWRSWKHGHVERQSRRRDPGCAPLGQLRAARLEHPGADIDDQAALLGGRHEFSRIAHRFARRLPAQQRLEPGQLAVAERVLRLVVERELAPLQRVVQAALRRQRRHALHRPIVEHGARAAVRLGAVHRQIGVAHQLIERRWRRPETA